MTLQELAETPPLREEIVNPKNEIGLAVATIETGTIIPGGTEMIIQETETTGTETGTAMIMAAEKWTATRRIRGGGGTTEGVMSALLPDVATAVIENAAGTTGSRLTETGSAREKAEPDVADETGGAVMPMTRRRTRKSGRRRRSLLGWRPTSLRHLVPAFSAGKLQTASWTEFKRGRRA